LASPSSTSFSTPPYDARESSVRTPLELYEVDAAAACLEKLVSCCSSAFSHSRVDRRSASPGRDEGAGDCERAVTHKRPWLGSEVWSAVARDDQMSTDVVTR
jgi:hypothetical protein